MLDRKHLERLLKINGLTLESGEDDIRSVLLAARYSADEATTALAVLREVGGERTEGVRSASVDKVLRSDGVLNSKDISQLLGIDVDVSSMLAERRRNAKKGPSTTREHVFLLLGALAFGVASFVAAMYFLEFGLFHPTAAAIFYGG